MAVPRTLKRYIRKRFLTAILGTFVLCTVLIFMIDFVEMLRQSGKLGDVAAWKLAHITLLRLPAYTEFLLSFAVLVGAIGALLALSRKSELTVMRAGGILTIFILGAILIGLWRGERNRHVPDNLVIVK